MWSKLKHRAAAQCCDAELGCKAQKLTLTSVMDLSFRGSKKRHNSTRGTPLYVLVTKSSTRKCRFFPELPGDSSPVCMQSVYPSCTCAVSSFCNITNTQNTAEHLQLIPKVQTTVSVSSDWQLIQCLFLLSIWNRTCLLTANFKIQFKLDSWHAFVPKSEKKKKKQTVTHKTLYKSSIYIQAVLALVPGIRRKPGWALRRACQLGDEAFCWFTSVHTVTQHSSCLARQLLQNIWLALLHRGTFSSSLITCHIESHCPLL